MMCTTCGRELNPDMKFCPTCGRPVTPAAPMPVSTAPSAQQVDPATAMSAPALVQPPVAQQPAVCTRCGAPLSHGLAFCTACGTPRSAGATPESVGVEAAQAQLAMSFCVKCGSAFAASSAFCTSCGAPRQPSAVTASNIEARAKNALLFETIGGYFFLLGLGHIYAGRALLGIILMIAWWFGLALLGAIAATGVGLLLAVPAFFGIPYFSGTQARNYIRANRI